MLEAYRQHVEERAAQGIPPLPLNAEQVNELVSLLKQPPAGEEDTLVDLLTNQHPGQKVLVFTEYSDTAEYITAAPDAYVERLDEAEAKHLRFYCRIFWSGYAHCSVV